MSFKTRVTVALVVVAIGCALGIFLVQKEKSDRIDSVSKATEALCVIAKDSRDQGNKLAATVKEALQVARYRAVQDEDYYSAREFHRQASQLKQLSGVECTEDTVEEIANP